MVGNNLPHTNGQGEGGGFTEVDSPEMRQNYGIGTRHQIMLEIFPSIINGIVLFISNRYLAVVVGGEACFGAVRWNLVTTLNKTKK